MSASEQLSLEAITEEPVAAGAEAEPVPAPPLEDVTAPAPHPPTPEQAEAIDARDRDVFLEAGAGTGKTRVLVSRYCDAIDHDGVEPERILAFTFTERAAAEMRRRVRIELSRRAGLEADPEHRARLAAAARAGEGTPVTTIHGFCRRLLAGHPVAAGLDPRFRVLDAEEAARLATQAYDDALGDLAATDSDVVIAAAGYRWRLAGIIRAAHSDLRNHGAARPELPPIQISALERGGKPDPGSPADVAHATAVYDALRRLLAAYADRYEELCAARSGVDFDHLQLLALRLLRERRAIAEAQRERFDHLLVDEFQDTSPIQIDLVRALAGPGTRLFAVGDEFQSIYAFRGADLGSFRRERERIRTHAEQFPAEAVVLPLSGSFRSDPDVVGAVNAVGAALLDDFNDLRVGRLPDGPPPGSEGEPAVELVLTRREGWADDDSRISTARYDASPARVAEARHLALRLRVLADDGVDPAGMVILLRAFTNVDVYAEALDLAGLDPHVVGGRGYWSAQQVTDALRLLACVANPLDDEALLGALASPACAASPDALWMLRRIAGRRRHLWPALNELHPAEAGEGEDPAADEPNEAEIERRQVAALWSGRIPPNDAERLRNFCDRLRELRAGAALLPLDTLVERTLETFDYDLTTLLADEGRRRTANLRKLVRIATEYEAHDGRDLRGFLDHAAARAAFSDREAEAATATEDHSGVRVMTIHAAKGLEFETVAVADLGRRLCTGGQPPELRLAFDAEAIAVASGEGPPPARVGLRLARAGAASIDTEGYGSLGDDAADAEAEESGRLAYVAVSRAERRLILSGVFGEGEIEVSEKPRRSRTALGCLLPSLGVSGEDGQVLTVPAPEPRAGLEASFGEVAVAVRVIGAGAESRARLSRDHRASVAADARLIKGSPPLAGTAEGGAAAARSLSYAALADYGRCGYRFLIERVVGLGGDATAAVPEGGGAALGEDEPEREWDEEVGLLDPAEVEAAAAAPDPRRHRMGFGRAVHELLEWSARNGWDMPEETAVAAALARESADPVSAERAGRMIESWLASPLLAELRGTDGVVFRPEVSFRVALSAGTVLRGTIDLLVSAPNADGGRDWAVLDYKTDSIGDGPPAELAAPYRLQRSLYAAAVAESTGAASVRSAYVFLQAPEQPLVEALDEAAIASGRERIEAVVGEIRASRFEPTPDPHYALCHDCPARDRLCPYPKELTGRASPEG